MMGIVGTYRFGIFTLDPVRYELRRREQRVRISGSLMELLLLLVARPGELVTREQIVAMLWIEPQSVDVRQGVNTAIARLRAVLEDDPAAPRYIETVIGRGYRFIGTVEIVPEAPIAVDNGMARIDAGAIPNAHSMPPDATPETGQASNDNPVPSGVALLELPEEAVAQVPWPSAPAAVRQPAFDKHISRVFPVGSILLLFVAVILGFAYRARLFKKVPELTPAVAYRQITTNDAEHPVSVATLSPDGNLLAYMDPAGIFILEVATGRTRLIPGPKLTATRLLWFPDQKQLLLTGFQSDANQPEIWTLSVSGEATRLIRRNADEGAPAPDGRSIAFTVEDGREIRLSNLDGTDERYVARGAEGGLLDKLFWSPNGRRINFQQRNAAQSPTSIQEDNYAWSFHSVDVETGHDTVVRQDVGFDSAGETVDGRIFYLRRNSNSGKDYNGVWTVQTDLATGGFLETPHRLDALRNDSVTGMSVSRDGTMSVIKHFGHQNIYYGQLKPSSKTLLNVRRLTSNEKSDYPHSWSADGKAVYFESARVGNAYHIFRQPIDSANAEMITFGDLQQFFPAIMPDGKTLVYEEWKRIADKRERLIIRAQADGSTPKPMWQGDELDEWRCPVVSGTTCVLRTLEGQHLFAFYVLNLESGKGPELAHTAWEPTIVGDWALSPDGRMAAIPNHDPSAPAIRLLALDGSQRETVIKVHQAAQLWGINWAPDGHGFFAEARVGLTHRLQYISLTGDVTVMRQTTSNTWGIATRDGKRLAFVDAVLSQNVYLLR